MPYPVPLNQKIFDNHEFLALYVSDQHTAAQITYLSTLPATSSSMNNYCRSNTWNDPSVSESRSLLNNDGKKNLEHLLTPLRRSYQKTLQIREEHQTFRRELISTFTYKNYSNMMAPLMWVTSGTCFMALWRMACGSATKTESLKKHQMSCRKKNSETQCFCSQTFESIHKALHLPCSELTMLLKHFQFQGNTLQ